MDSFEHVEHDGVLWECTLPSFQPEHNNFWSEVFADVASTLSYNGVQMRRERSRIILLPRDAELASLGSLASGFATALRTTLVRKGILESVLPSRPDTGPSINIYAEIDHHLRETGRALRWTLGGRVSSAVEHNTKLRKQAESELFAQRSEHFLSIMEPYISALFQAVEQSADRAVQQVIVAEGEQMELDRESHACARVTVHADTLLALPASVRLSDGRELTLSLHPEAVVVSHGSYKQRISTSSKSAFMIEGAHVGLPGLVLALQNDGSLIVQADETCELRVLNADTRIPHVDLKWRQEDPDEEGGDEDLA